MLFRTKCHGAILHALADRKSLERKRERERTPKAAPPKAALGRGSGADGMGADSCSQERILGALLRCNATFPNMS